MIALLGPPPQEMLQESSYSTNFFDTEGTLPERGLTRLRPLTEEIKAFGREPSRFR